MTVDTSVIYRLRNEHLGSGRSLDAGDSLEMAATGDSIGQRWRFVPLRDETFALRASSSGDCYSLDTRNDGRFTPCIAPAADYTGQIWTAQRQSDGTYRLTNEFAGPERSFGVDPATGAPRFAAGEGATQRWTLTAIGNVADEVPVPGRIPQLFQGEVLHHSEGPGDYDVCKLPRGRVTGVMIFVDFPDVPAATTSAALTGEHLLGGGKAQRLFRDQSYGRFELDVTVRSDLGWRRMPDRSTCYDTANGDRHRQYVSTVVSLFRPEEVRFSDYDIVFMVAAETEQFPLSPAFLVGPLAAEPSPSGPIAYGVSFGADSYRNWYVNLVHEVGHLIGLPDLYQMDGTQGEHKAGCWDLMSDIFHSVSFLGWHRHKNGWLPDERKTYIAESRHRWRTTLHPLTGLSGLSLIVLPIDDVGCPSKVFLVELAQPVIGTDGQPWGDWVLVYTVDATVESGQCPVVVIPRIESYSDTYGDLYEAPYREGEVAEVTDHGAQLTVAVVRRIGSAYEIEVTYEPVYLR